MALLHKKINSVETQMLLVVKWQLTPKPTCTGSVLRGFCLRGKSGLQQARV